MKKGISDQGINRIAQEMGGNSEETEATDNLLKAYDIVWDALIDAGVNAIKEVGLEYSDEVLELIFNDGIDELIGDISLNLGTSKLL